MALSVGEANAVNQLLNYLLNRVPATGSRVTGDEARAAAETLAKQANKRLYAGLNGDDVRAQWKGGEPPAVERLERDANRYKWLRARDLEAIGQGGVFAGMTPDNLVLNGEDLDAAIDRAMAQ